MKTLLVIDVGNTNVKYALMKNGRQLKFWSHPTADTASACSQTLSRSRAPIALCSVVPAAAEIIARCAGKRRLLEVSAANQTILKDMPPGMGADRVAAAVASWKLYGRGSKPVLSMTFGTATTALLIDSDGRQRGGWIHPGVTMTLESLHRCALLPLLKMDNPSTDLGHDTATHVCNGVLVGHIGLVREYMARTASAMGLPRILTVATGGWSNTLRAHGAPFDHVDNELTAKGIYLAARSVI